MKTNNQSLYARFVFAAGLALVLLSGGCAKVTESAKPSLATSANSELHQKMDTAMRKFGKVIQMARACGISEDEMRGVNQYYSAVLGYYDTVKETPNLTAAEKQEYQSPSELKALFLTGAQSALDRGPPTVEECTRIKATWSLANEKLAGVAASYQAQSKYLQSLPGAENARKTVGASE